MSDYQTIINPFTGLPQKVLKAELIHMKDPVDTYNDLPTSGNAENNARFVKDTDKLYVWSIPSATGNLTDWKEVGTLAISDLDGVPDGSTYGRVLNTELTGNQVKRLDDGTNEVEASDAKDAVDKKHDHSNKAILDLVEEELTTALKTAYDDAVTKAHTHGNKAILDGIEEALTTALKNSYDNAVAKVHEHSNKVTLDLIEEAFTTALKNKLDGIENGAVSLSTVKADVDISDAISKKHDHANKSILDLIEEEFTTGLKNKLDGIESGAVALSTVKADSDISDAITKKHGHTNKTELDLVTDGDHDIRTDNPHNLTPASIGESDWIQSIILNTPSIVTRLFGQSDNGFKPDVNVRLLNLSVQYYSEHPAQSRLRVRVYRYDANAATDRLILSITQSGIAVGYHSIEDNTPDTNYYDVDQSAGDTFWIEVDDGTGSPANRVREITISMKYIKI